MENALLTLPARDSIEINRESAINISDDDENVCRSRVKEDIFHWFQDLPLL